MYSKPKDITTNKNSLQCFILCLLLFNPGFRLLRWNNGKTKNNTHQYMIGFLFFWCKTNLLNSSRILKLCELKTNSIKKPSKKSFYENVRVFATTLALLYQKMKSPWQGKEYKVFITLDFILFNLLRKTTSSRLSNNFYLSVKYN